MTASTPSLRGHWALLLLGLCVLPFASRAEPAARNCGERSAVALQILGSGGPELTHGRASSSYLVWVDGRARVLVDLGPGAMLRFGEAGARIEDLEVVAISHLHVDHGADVPALVKAGYFGTRTAPLPLIGPAAEGVFPATSAWLRANLDGSTGAYRYLAGALDGTDGHFALAVRDASTVATGPTLVHATDELRIEALPVPHGSVPSLAFRVRVGGRTLVFGGDQNGRSAAFWEFAKDADVLVAHLAVPEDIGGPARQLHAVPSTLGDGAARSGVRRLVLSHLMTRSESRLAESLRSIEARYRGPVDVARDLSCVPLRARD